MHSVNLSKSFCYSISVLPICTFPKYQELLNKYHSCFFIVLTQLNHSPQLSPQLPQWAN
ncbi:hypothetical protein K443DRAFT_12952 [Laccaria amethystina LaAM-08-1]|uniref:Uncharacterized protein n=1 Tax=Laccaria amethystina LaAM-08-1 TaxID=1095629 RepID=A0A0C9X6S1_9AGAR|nr:hypothetical protein K443DRAFT_12952 [Laccaria amethystina LaAM-08-1]